MGGKGWSGAVPFLRRRAKMEASLRRLLLPLLVVLTGTSSATGWEQPERVLLRDVQVLTLYQGKYTNYRRTSPVPQLQCTGGSAGCTASTPEVVQCYNKGWDGSDVQWECKAHLDVSYRFGKIEVSCEGYDYPADPFILKGSCGLEYTLELTKKGQQKADTFSGTYYSATSHDSFGSGFGVILVILFVVFVFGIYKLFLCDNRQHNFPDDNVHSGSYGQNYQSPPPPGFKSNYTGATSGSSYDSNSGPGFWTGLGAGGLLGYLIGNRRSPSDHRYNNPYYSTWAGLSASPPFTGSFGNSNSCSTSYSSETKPTSEVDLHRYTNHPVDQDFTNGGISSLWTFRQNPREVQFLLLYLLNHPESCRLGQLTILVNNKQMLRPEFVYCAAIPLKLEERGFIFCLSQISHLSTCPHSRKSSITTTTELRISIVKKDSC